MSPENPREKLPHRVSDLHREARKRRRKTGVIILIGSLIISVVFIWWFGFNSKFLRFESIEVQGNTRLTDQEVIQTLEEKLITPHWWRRTLGLDHFLAWPRSVPVNLLPTLGNIQAVTFSPDYWYHRLTIFVHEHQFFGILCARKIDPPQCAWFDKDGLLFEDAFFPDGVLVIRLDDYSREVVHLGEYVYSGDKLKNILSVFAVIQKLDLPVAAWTVQDLAQQNIEVHLIDGPVLYFNLDLSSDYTLQVIRSLIGQKGIRNLDYIDFRIKDRAYYKEKK